MSSLAPTRPQSPSSSIFDPPQYGLPHLVTPDRTYIAKAIPISRSSSAAIGPAASYVVVSGGTGCNALTGAFGNETTYVLPVSDDGGSSAEIIRVLGGPSIGKLCIVTPASHTIISFALGDIRSRLIRLIPPAPKGSAEDSIRRLLSHRFPGTCSDDEARFQWREVVEGRSRLWRGIPADRKVSNQTLP
jgi:hypothetical protein